MLACPECSRPFDQGLCACRRDWTETGGVSDVYVAATDLGESTALTSRVRAWYEEHPAPLWKPDESRESLVRQCLADPVLAALDAELSPAARVLDLGCGTGHAAAFLAMSGREAVGVDSAMAGLIRGEAARRKLEINSVTFIRGNAFRPPIAPGSADAVLVLDTAEVTGNPEAVVLSAARSLAPGGVLVLRFRTPWAPPEEADKPEGPPEKTSFSPDEAVEWMSKAGVSFANADPPLAPFAVSRPLLGPASRGSWVSAVARRARWALRGGPARAVIVGRKAG